jgi:para-nitrobenzyl esterase
MNMMDVQGIIKVKSGLLRGQRDGDVTAYRGVPFAQPPVGPLRFRAPLPAQPWSGIRDATHPDHASYQINFVNQQAVKTITQAIDPGMPGVIAGPESVFATYCHNDVSEDCLYLDIWVPDAARREAVPVYVYYHGGANMVSSGSFELERGANLAREAGIIVVRPNYRLGALGWVHFGLLGAGLPEAVNLGVQDQFEALKWVRENIEAFGGDPKNVTIGGESAGATAVSHFLCNPAAHLFFRRAVLQSLSPFNPWCTQQHEEAVFVAQKYLELLNIESTADLQDIDPNKLIAAQNLMARYIHPDQHVAWRALGAVVDGHWVPQLPAVHLSENPIGKHDLEVVIGFAKDEWLFFRGHTETIKNGSVEDVLASLKQVFGKEGAITVYDRYKELYPDHAPGRLLSDILSFEFFKLPSMAIARNLSAQQIPVRLFQFSYDLPGLGGRLHAVHTGDMPFVFRNYEERDLAVWPFFEGVSTADIRGYQGEVKRIGAEMGALYDAFIRTGDPGEAWPTFEETDQSVLWFGKSVESRPRLLTPEWDLYSKLGFGTVRSLEDALVRNLRSALTRRHMASQEQSTIGLSQ